MGSTEALARDRYGDIFDWHGCSAVRFDPEKLGGRATVLGTRMDAYGVLLNHLSGSSAEEIAEMFESDLDAVKAILAFATERSYKAVA